MRLYEVQFSHPEHGTNFTARTVCVRGFVPEAIVKAVKTESRVWGKVLRVEQVRLIGQEK